MSHFHDAVSARFQKMSEFELYEVDIEGDALYAAYLAAFPEGTNPIFRKRTEHDCSTCKSFIRNLGKVVTIKNGVIETVWEGNFEFPYNVVAATMRAIVGAASIKSIFRTKEAKYGNHHNYDAAGERYEHFVGTVSTKHYCKDPGTKKGEADAVAQVLQRGLTELSSSALSAVKDLIDSNALYRGEEHLAAVQGFCALYLAHKETTNKNLFLWNHINHRSARFRNTVIGTLVVDLSEGKDLDHAVKSFEDKVAPQNYKRPTALVTKRMVDDAVKTINELGIEPLLERRFAVIEDVSVNDVLWVDNSSRGKMRGGVAGLLDAAVKPSQVDLKGAQPITGDEFLAMLQKVRSLDVLVENRHLGNFVSLTTGEPGLFRWGNGFAWSYDGEVADSIKSKVQKAGGKVDALLRVSLAWKNYDDLDLHMEMPTGNHVFYAAKQGMLDVDMNAGRGVTRDAVENIALDRLQPGRYKFWVNQFCRREHVDVGFQIEIDHVGVTRQFSYEKALSQAQKVPCFVVEVTRDGQIKLGVEPGLVEKSISVAKWGVHTETLVPVETALLSPNYWNGSLSHDASPEGKRIRQGVGNRHLFFILKGCLNPEGTRGIYNEFLVPRLESHRKVFEILGSKTKTQPSERQLSGVGFSSTRQDAVRLVADGRAYEVKF